jgi:hypothetical protein
MRYFKNKLIQMKKILLLGLWATSVFAFAQQNPTAVKYAATITEKNLKDDLTIIASDALEGRETGKRGQKMAAAFIAAYFQDLNLKAPRKRRVLSTCSAVWHLCSYRCIESRRYRT